MKDKNLSSYAEYCEVERCQTLNEFYDKNGYKYKKYKEAVYFIREEWDNNFLGIADNWTIQYGKYKK